MFKRLIQRALPIRYDKVNPALVPVWPPPTNIAAKTPVCAAHNTDNTKSQQYHATFLTPNRQWSEHVAKEREATTSAIPKRLRHADWGWLSERDRRRIVRQ